MILTEVRVKKGEFTGWIRDHSISGRKFQGWVAWSSPFSASFCTPPSCDPDLIFYFPGPLILLATLSSLSSIYPHSRPSFLNSWEPGKRIKAGSVGTGRARTSQWAGIRDLEIQLAAHAARAEGVQMAISFTVIEDCASLGSCLQLECMISLSFLWQLFLLLAFTVFSKCQWYKTNSDYSKILHATLYYLPFCGKTRIFILTPHFMAWRSHYNCL